LAASAEQQHVNADGAVPKQWRSTTQRDVLKHTAPIKNSPEGLCEEASASAKRLHLQAAMGINTQLP
jgi:hypothetical protein